MTAGAVIVVGLVFLGFAYSKDLGAAIRAHTLSGGFAVLHFDRRWVLDLSLSPTLHTVRLHREPPFCLISAKQTSRQLYTCQ